MAGKDLAVGAVAIGVLLVILSVALIPVAVDFYSDESSTINQSVDDNAVGIVGDVESNVTNTDGAATPSEVTVETTYGDITEVSTVSEGDNVTVTYEGDDIEITADEVDDSNDSATLTYEYGSTFGLPSGVVSLIGATIILIFTSLLVAVVKPFK